MHRRVAPATRGRDDAAMPLLLEPDRYLGETRVLRRVAGLILTETFHTPARLPLHTHSAPFFCLVMSGAFDERVDGTVCEARPGELLFHPPGEAHADEIRAETRIFNIALGGSWTRRLEQLESRGRPRPGHQSRAAARVARRVAQELSARDPVSTLAIEGLVLTLLAEAAHRPESVRGGAPRWLPVALEFIRAHVRERFDHETLARIAGVHATHLARAFHRHMGCTVTGYLHRLRIEWARGRVARGEAPLADLALEAGFADQAHFTRVFRRETGSTPSAYRRRARSRPGR